MKIEIPISDDLMDRLELLSKKFGYTLEETSSFVLKSGISQLLNQSCGTCGHALGTKYVVCNSCSLLFDCGYLYIQLENTWKGDRWLIEPSIICYSCMIFNELERNFESLVNPISEEEIWRLKEEFPKIIEDIVKESIRTTGDGETEIMSFPIKTDHVEPISWDILSSKIDKYLIHVVHEKYL